MGLQVTHKEYSKEISKYEKEIVLPVLLRGFRERTKELRERDEEGNKYSPKDDTKGAISFAEILKSRSFWDALEEKMIKKQWKGRVETVDESTLSRIIKYVRVEGIAPICSSKDGMFWGEGESIERTATQLEKRGDSSLRVARSMRKMDQEGYSDENRFCGEGNLDEEERIVVPILKRELSKRTRSEPRMSTVYEEKNGKFRKKRVRVSGLSYTEGPVTIKELAENEFLEEEARQAGFRKKWNENVVSRAIRHMRVEGIAPICATQNGHYWGNSFSRKLTASSLEDRGNSSKRVADRMRENFL